MLSKSIQDALNKQVQMEAESSQAYLAMASWAEIQPGLVGVTEFFYKQSDEERVHMLKLLRFVNERGGFAVVPALEQPTLTFTSLKKLFEEFLKHELKVSNSINDLVHLSL
ncbi:MAG: ferritin, partial [Chitinophagaceae bacterium]|nr:ferritin [Chitinophagaceae bacterium]